MSSEPSVLDALRRCPLFIGLDERTLLALLQAGRLRRYTRNEALFDEGQHARGLYLLIEGSVKIYKLNEAGREQILHIQHPLDAIAELPLFDDGNYPASAAAMEDTAVFYLPKDTFEALLQKNPALGRAVIAALARRLRTLVALVEDLSLRNVRGRLAQLLLKEADGKDVFMLKQTNEELAARLGSVRDVISRTLGAFQTERMIKLDGRRVSILRRERLADE